jgi:hypothetical protein
MQLWTDYEGVTIDGAFPLQKLLIPEGRSAFFSTAGPNGEPTIVRLIECHFDEEEILARWRCVEALNHPNFLRFERYGQTELDGRPVVYAVFEKVDANLAGVLDEGHLTVKDVSQLASSLVAALDVLHTHGFVHEHIEPRNIFAVNEAVKLRSDCIREAPEGEEGRAAKQRDVHDLATVILQALTQRQSLEGISDFEIPPPFGQIVRNGLNGTWSLQDIRAALEGLFDSKLPTARRSIPTTSKPVNATLATPAVPGPNVPVAEKPPSAASEPSVQPEVQLSLPLLNENRYTRTTDETAGNGKWGLKDALGQAQSFSLRSRWLGVAVIVAFVLLLSTWALAHAWNAHRPIAAQTAEPVSQQAPLSTALLPTGPVPKPTAARSPRTSIPTSASSGAGWRVISFTYNRRADAEKKVSALAASHPELHPTVFTPSGRAPYLVSIGGVMDRDAAYALARRSSALGLPHDSYAQNYSH